MKIIDLYECSACGAIYADRLSMCDCMEEGCDVFIHYKAKLTKVNTVLDEAVAKVLHKGHLSF